MHIWQFFCVRVCVLMIWEVDNNTCYLKSKNCKKYEDMTSGTSLSLFFFCLCSVDADEIKRLGKRFKKLDLDNSGSLSVEEFMSLPELQQNPLVQRVIDIFDTDGNGEVDFKGMHKLYWCRDLWLLDFYIFILVCIKSVNCFKAITTVRVEFIAVFL